MKKILIAALFSIVLIPVLASAQQTGTRFDDTPEALRTLDAQRSSAALAQQYQAQQAALSSGSSNAGISACSTLISTGLSGVVNCLIGFMNSIMFLLMAGAVVYTVYGAFNMITKEEKREEAKQTIYYGIIGLFVMISVWGLVNILDRTFNLSGEGPKAPPALIR